MPELNDPAYYRRRAEKSRESASRAQSIEARVIHEEMAAMYAELETEATRSRPARTVVVRLPGQR